MSFVNMNKLIIFLILFISISCQSNQASVFFPNLKDGQKISSSYNLEMGVKGLQIKPAGKFEEGTGHHHLVIDDKFVEKGTVVPANANHIHFGKGQTNYDLKLTPGKHSLTLQFADGLHRSYGKELSKSVTVIVE